MEVVGLVPALHLEAAAAPPLEVLQSTVRDLVPVELQVDVEQALHVDETHAGWSTQQVARSVPLASHVVPTHVAALVDGL